MTGQSKSYGPNCGGIDNQEGYTDCPYTLNFGAYDKNNVLPYSMNFTLNVEWQPRQGPGDDPRLYAAIAGGTR